MSGTTVIVGRMSQTIGRMHMPKPKRNRFGGSDLAFIDLEVSQHLFTHTLTGTFCLPSLSFPIEHYRTVVNLPLFHT